MKTNILVRMASNKDGDAIKGMARNVGLDDVTIDWSDVYPYWLIAEFEDKIIGMVQVCPSRPIGRLEMLFVTPDLPFGTRKLATVMLMTAGVETLKQNGAQYVSGVVSFKQKKFKEWLKRRGAVTALSGNMMFWRC